MKQNDDWTIKLRDRLADYEEPVPADLWTAIEGQLPVAAPAPARRVWLWRVAAVAASLLLLVGVAQLFMQPATETMNECLAEDAQMVAEPQGINRADGIDEIDENSEVNRANRADGIDGNNGNNGTDGIDGNNGTDGIDGENESNETNEADGSYVPQENLLSQETQEPASSVSDSKNRTVEGVLPTAGTHAAKDAHRLQIGLLASSAVEGRSTEQPVLMNPSMVSQYASLASRRSEPVYLTDYTESEKHHAPVSLGLMVSYTLTPRLSIGSGVVYTQLSSDFISTVKQHQIVRHQQMSYVGMPLSLQYRLLQYHGLRLYGGTGVQADLNVHARMEQDGVVRTVAHDRLRLSASVSAGVQYDFGMFGGVYVEPGLRYYLDNGSETRNAMTERPLGFGVQLGYRISIGN